MAAEHHTTHTREAQSNVYRTFKYRGLGGVVALVFSLVACYGTMAVVATLSALGIVLSLNDAMWSGTIVFFALLTTAMVGMGIPEHGAMAPTLLAISGTALLGYVMFVQFDRVSEVVAFGVLAAAVLRDYRLRAAKRARTSTTHTSALGDLCFPQD